VTTLLLGLALLVVGGLGVALLELLLRRADVAAALVFGSVVVRAYFVDRVPALVLPGGVQVYVTERRARSAVPSVEPLSTTTTSQSPS
jgi:hypothetical protein